MPPEQQSLEYHGGIFVIFFCKYWIFTGRLCLDTEEVESMLTDMGDLIEELPFMHDLPTMPW